jgi:iron complex transport system substrate-binding protein
MKSQKYSLRASIGNVICVFFCLILIYLSCGCTSPSHSIKEEQPLQKNSSILVTDALGTTIIFSQPVQRIICQNGLAAEILIDIGAGNRIVGVTDTAMKEPYLMNQIPQAKSIGEIRNPDLEKIVDLHPDVFIAYGDSGSIPGNIDKILAANITVLYVKIYDIRDTANETRILGKITGREPNAEEFIQFTETYQSLIERRIRNVSSSESPKVYLEQLVDYMVTHQGSSGDYVLNFIHARNIAGNISVPYAIVDPEWVIDQDPDIIIKQVTRGQNVTDARNDILNRPGFSRMHAVSNRRVYALSSNMLSGPRQIVGILYLAKAVYPDRFTDIDPEAVLHQYAEKFMPGSDPENLFFPELLASQQLQANNSTSM